MLDDASFKAFLQSGWVLLPAFLSPEAQVVLRSWADGIHIHCDASCLHYYEVSADGDRVLSRVESFLEPDHPLAFFIHASSPLMHVVTDLLGDAPVLFKDKINLKPPGGGAYTVHQDAPAYQGFGISSFITAMIAVDDATVANGCLEFATGSRTTRELRLDDSGQIVISEIEGVQFHPVPMRSGDVIVFDGLVPHRSAPNHSSTARRAMFLTFNPKKEGDKRGEYYALKRQLFPPEDQRLNGRDYHKAGRQFNLGNPFR